MHADAASEFNNDDFKNKCLEKGIVVTLGAPWHQHQNGCIERPWQTLRNIAYALLVEARLGMEFFCLAFEYAHFIFAILPVRTVFDEEGNICTPHYLLFQQKPNVRKF